MNKDETLWEENLLRFLTDNPPPETGCRLPRIMSIVEKYLCDWAYSKANNRRTKGAKLLGIQRTTFYEKQKRWGNHVKKTGGQHGAIVPKD